MMFCKIILKISRTYLFIKEYFYYFIRLTPPICITTDELNAAADIIITVVRNAEKLLIEDYIEKPKPVFNFTKVDENYSKILNKVFNKNEHENESNHTFILHILNKF